MSKSKIRPIRSYVLRQGRLTKHQAEGIKIHSPLFAIPFNDDAINVVEDAGVKENAGVCAELGERDAAIVAADPADDARKDDEGELVFMLMNE